ncbi:MAG: hypothetical protein ACREKL_08110, partial [Chthoniobacterales bacterium]
MKRNKLTLAFTALAAALALAIPAGAQTATVTTLNSAGTVTEYTPNAITIRASTEADPVAYTVSKTTTYVDDTGAPVSMEVVKSGAPVTVYYTKSDAGMIADRVVVSRTTTTASTS